MLTQWNLHFNKMMTHELKNISSIVFVTISKSHSLCCQFRMQSIKFNRDGKRETLHRHREQRKFGTIIFLLVFIFFFGVECGKSQCAPVNKWHFDSELNRFRY